MKCTNCGNRISPNALCVSCGLVDAGPAGGEPIYEPDAIETLQNRVMVLEQALDNIFCNSRSRYAKDTARKALERYYD